MRQRPSSRHEDRVVTPLPEDGSEEDEQAEGEAWGLRDDVALLKAGFYGKKLQLPWADDNVAAAKMRYAGELYPLDLLIYAYDRDEDGNIVKYAHHHTIGTQRYAVDLSDWAVTDSILLSISSLAYACVELTL